MKATKSFVVDQSAAVAIVFAMALPMVMTAAGVAVDLAQAYNVKNRLADALDKAALAGGSSTGAVDDVEDRVEEFFKVNYPSEKLGTPFDLIVDVDEDEGTVYVSASARVDLTFMSVFGSQYGYLNVFVESKVKRELAGVAAVLVVDVTGSMSGSRIAALKTASTNFMNIMFTNIEDEEYIKIGIVPFSQSVNVGPYGLGQTYSGGNYGTPFVDRPTSDDYISPASNINYGTGANDWQGCIVERNYPQDTTDDPPTPNWGMYRWPLMCRSWGYSYWSGYYCASYTTPNYRCPSDAIVPLTNVRSTLQARIDGLQTQGNTYGNIGMAWGYRVITPTEPFIEAPALDDPKWTHSIIMMTDGDNTTNNTYSGYGSYPGLNSGDLDDRFAEICTNAKNDGINVYTITFQSGISDSTRDLFEECASDPSKYFDAPGDDDLVQVFEHIASQLSQLHIVQ